jgi:RNA polymerase-interacting CarD/CdnL/TRCF family regulator
MQNTIGIRKQLETAGVKQVEYTLRTRREPSRKDVNSRADHKHRELSRKDTDGRADRKHVESRQRDRI